MSEHPPERVPTPGSGPATGSAPSTAAPPSAPKREPRRDDGVALVRRGWFGWEAPATVGATTIAISCVLAVVFVQQASRGTSTPRMSTLDAVLWTLLGGPVLIALGVVALWIGAWTGRVRLGDTRLACARMAAIVGVTMLVWALGPFVVRIAPVEWALSVLVYIGALWLTIRPGRRELVAIAGSHLLLSAIVVGFVLYVLPRMWS